MSKIRTLLSALALATMSIGAAQAQNPPMPAELPPSQAPAPEGQLSAPMQDRGATGDAATDDAARQRAMQREAERLARQRERGPEGEMSVPNQDRSWTQGWGETSSSNLSTQ